MPTHRTPTSKEHIGWAALHHAQRTLTDSHTPKKLSKKYHPDINPDESAHEKFIEVSKGRFGHVDIHLELTTY